jgi:hypothetical protein
MQMPTVAFVAAECRTLRHPGALTVSIELCEPFLYFTHRSCVYVKLFLIPIIILAGRIHNTSCIPVNDSRSLKMMHVQIPGEAVDREIIVFFRISRYFGNELAFVAINVCEQQP